MSMNIRANGGPDELLRKVEALSAQRLANCYQCGTCSGGCPLVGAMDLLPDMLIRHLSVGLPGVLERQTFWVCVGCDTCVDRCPRGIDVARIMEALRQIHLRERSEPPALAHLTDTQLGELPPIALVASMRRSTS
ncbi:4Fe-4S dicluster domain-containing protein [Candidatus Viridilinea mediisalina]|uniref:4Fe-4S ferredoxin-type domain-containing protein n=1 Tax=Candidatus Viridilinea mediisalina TaxID=2024553 RepID=A0A2A6RIV5_9CHLR|nr:4Fe-4S dicluster domain-containing protein [Candidatus Viridilinea mediisalina]PDW03054.1 hypothetical protein CJ255_10735 [Candidatus Viridilinea mediisalina]